MKYGTAQLARDNERSADWQDENNSLISVRPLYRPQSPSSSLGLGRDCLRGCGYWPTILANEDASRNKKEPSKDRGVEGNIMGGLLMVVTITSSSFANQIAQP